MTEPDPLPQKARSGPPHSGEGAWSQASEKILKDLNRTLKKNALRISWRENKLLFLVLITFLLVISLLMVLALIVTESSSSSSSAEDDFGSQSFSFFSYLTFGVGVFVFLSGHMFYTLSGEPAADQLMFLSPLDLGAWFRVRVKERGYNFLLLVCIMAPFTGMVAEETGWGLPRTLLTGFGWLNCVALFVFSFIYLETLKRDGRTGTGAAVGERELWRLKKALDVSCVLFFFPLLPYFLFFKAGSLVQVALVVVLLQFLSAFCIYLWSRDVAPGAGNSWRWAHSFDQDNFMLRRHQQMKYLQDRGASLPMTPELPGTRAWWEYFYPLSQTNIEDSEKEGIAAADQFFRVQLLRRPGLYVGGGLLLGFTLAFLALRYTQGHENEFAFLLWFLLMIVFFSVWPVFYFDVLGAHPGIGSKFSLFSDSAYAYEFFHLMPFSPREVMLRLYRFHFLFFLTQFVVFFSIILMVAGTLDEILNHGEDILLYLFYSSLISLGLSVVMVGFLLRKNMFLSFPDSPLSIIALVVGLFVTPFLCILSLGIMAEGLDLGGIYGSGGEFWQELDWFLKSPGELLDPAEFCCFFTSFCSLPLITVLAIFLGGSNFRRYRRMSIRR